MSSRRIISLKIFLIYSFVLSLQFLSCSARTPLLSFVFPFLRRSIASWISLFVISGLVLNQAFFFCPQYATLLFVGCFCCFRIVLCDGFPSAAAVSAAVAASASAAFFVAIFCTFSGSASLTSCSRSLYSDSRSSSHVWSVSSSFFLCFLRFQLRTLCCDEVSLLFSSGFRTSS